LNQNQNFFLPLSSLTVLDFYAKFQCDVFIQLVCLQQLFMSIPLILTAIFTMLKNQKQRIYLKFYFQQNFLY